MKKEESNFNELVTIDQLRKQARKPPSFCGTGGLKLKANECTYRFYNEALVPRLIENVHTHTYSFRSRILKGVLRNILYDVKVVDEETGYHLTKGKCGKDTQPQEIAENVLAIETFRTDMPAGTTYEIDSETFHGVEFMTDTIITALSPFAFAPDHPKFVEKKGNYVCPWGDVYISPSDCWEIIDQMLAD